MQTIELQPPCTTTSTHLNTRTPLQALALYDGLISLVYARETLQALSMATTPAVHVQSSLWSFDMLFMRDMHQTSARAATGVNLLIVAGSRTSPLPAQVKSWLTNVLQRTDGCAPVLVAIYEEDGRAPANAVSALREDLSQIAARWNTPLLCNTEFDERLEGSLMPELVSHQTLRRTNGHRAAPPPSRPVRPIRHYGIND